MTISSGWMFIDMWFYLSVIPFVITFLRFNTSIISVTHCAPPGDLVELYLIEFVMEFFFLKKSIRKLLFFYCSS